MPSPRKRELLLLVWGDIAFFYAILWLTLFVRYGGQTPSRVVWDEHLLPFSLLFIVWTAVFFIAGLYEKHTAVFKRELVSLVAYAMVFNIILSALFFFFVPIFGIAPKTNLAIYLAFALALLPLWRIYLFPFFAPRKKDRALIIGDGDEILELVSEVTTNSSRYSFIFADHVNLADFTSFQRGSETLKDILKKEDISLIVADPRKADVETLLPPLFLSLFEGKTIVFIDFIALYEDIFDRVPLSQLSHRWFLEDLTHRSRPLYDIVKRGMDIVGALALGIVLLVLYPFVALAIKLDTPGSVLISQERTGRYMRPIRVYKFRSMTENKAGSAEWTKEEKDTNKITRAGAFLRKTSIDELPQMWSVLKGDLSLIGPRSDIAGIASRLERSVPYYAARYIARPGITGWAQTQQRYEEGNISPQSMEESVARLSYDLYYVKNRSLTLDLVIALRTLSALISRLKP